MIAPRSIFPHFPSSAGPCAPGLAAPEGASSSLPSSGAAAFFTDEGDLIAVPPFERVAGNRFSSARACVGVRESVGRDAVPHANDLAGGHDAGSATPCEAEKGRQAVPSGGLPLPQGPP